jgi:pyridoxine kinase
LLLPDFSSLSFVGYVPGAEALLVMADFAAGLRDKNPDLLFVLDRELRIFEELIIVAHLFWKTVAVMGDDGKLYVADDVLPVYRDRLLPLATIITPNWFEVECVFPAKFISMHSPGDPVSVARLLTGIQLSSRDSLRSALKSLHTTLGVRHVVITSVVVRRGSKLLGEVANADLGAENTFMGNGLSPDTTVPDEFILCVSSSAQGGSNERPTVHALAVPRIKGYFSGVGDLFSALVLAHFETSPPLSPSSPTNTTALSRAASRALHTTHAVLRRTQEHALNLTSNDSSAYTDDELDAGEPLRRVRRMRTRELRIVQSRDDILACADGRGGVEEMRSWDGFWED